MQIMRSKFDPEMLTLRKQQLQQYFDELLAERIDELAEFQALMDPPGLDG